MTGAPQAATPTLRRNLAHVAGVLCLGGAASGLLIDRTLASISLDWRVDAAMGWMVILLFAPAGPAWLGCAMLLFVRRRAWRRSDLIWPAAGLVELAWCGVLLDGGARIGAVGKLLSGATALAGTPLLVIAAFVMSSSALFGSVKHGSPWQWCGIVLSLVAGAGWSMFLWVMLPLRF